MRTVVLVSGGFLVAVLCAPARPESTEWLWRGYPVAR